MEISIVPTPNPQSLKFKTSSPIASEHWEISLVEKADRSPLAKKNFRVSLGRKSVYRARFYHC